MKRFPRKELERKWGTHLFELAEIQLKTFSPEIIEDMVKENKLITEYEKLISSAKIVFEGEERNLSQLQPFMESKDREVRKRAYEAHSISLRKMKKNLIRYMMN